MNSRVNVPARLGSTVSMLLVGCALLAPGAASAEATGVLSPDLAEMAGPTLRNQSAIAQARTLGLPVHGTGSLEREGEDVTVEIGFAEGVDDALPALRAAGAQIGVVSETFQRASASVAPADLTAVAAVPGVTSVEEVRAPIYAGIESPHTSVDAKATCEGGSVLTEGLDQLEVVSQPNRTGAREAFGVRGAGVTVGVLSDSFDGGSTISKYNKETKKFEEVPIPTHAAEDIQTEDLPGPEGTCSGQQTPVKIVQEGSEGPPNHDEGRAMLQVIHDVAPHAALAFATAGGGELNMAHNIELLAAPVSSGGAGANVIVDDVTYPEEPMFQDGPIAAAINKVTAAGVTYVTAAGNNNFADEATEKEEVGSWEIASFKDTENASFCPIPVGVANRHCLDFEPGSGEDPKYGFTIEQGKPVEVAVGWSEPEYGLKADLDVYLLREVPEKEAIYKGETKVVSESKADNIANGRPAAYVQWTNPSPEEGKTEKLFVVVNRCVGNICDQSASSTAKPRVKLIFLAHIFPNPIKGVEFQESVPGEGIVVGPTIFGHAGDPSAVTIGASNFAVVEKEGELAETAKTNYSGVPQIYSSRGPVTHYWAPVNGTTPSAALPAAEVIEKPNVVATDCNANTFYTNATFYLGFWRFCGTSASAPHVAGIAALMKQASPSQSPAGIRAAIASSAVNPKAYGSNIVGKGLVQARRAIEALSNRVTVNDPPSTIVPKVTPTPPTPESETTPTPTPIPSTPTQTTRTATGGEAKGTSEERGLKSTRVVPTTTIKKHPAKIVKSPVGRPKLTFGFVSDVKGAKFECSIDKAKWKACPATYKAFFTLGEHELKVRARGDGVVDKSPAVFKFTVKLVA